MENKIVPNSIACSDTFIACNVLDVSDFRHFRINHSKLCADPDNHINGTENFWKQTKRHMRKFNDGPKDHRPLLLKNYDGRFEKSNLQSEFKATKIVD